DLARFHSWLLATFPDMSAVFYNANRADAADVRPLAAIVESLGREDICLVPAWAVDSLVFRPPGSKVTVDSFDSPVLEYSPPVAEERDQSLRVGRVYWGYTGTLESHQKRDVDSIFKWIRSHSVPHNKWRYLRMFPSAARFRSLHSGVGQ